MQKSILGYLEDSALRYGNRTACADENTSYTFSELTEKAKRIGSALAAVTKPRSPIPLFMEKSCATLAGFMGAAYAGCFYVTLDPTLPPARLKVILDTLEAEFVVVCEATAAKIEKLEFNGRIFVLEELMENEADEEVLSKIASEVLDIDPLYSIFTSGSTGIPKGVVVSHRSVIDFIDHFTEVFGFDETDVIGNQAPFDFDVSVKDIYSSLKTGATLQIIPKKLFSFPMKLLDYLEERKITSLTWAVSALCIVTTLKGFDYKVPSGIRKVIFSGEVMPVKHLNEWMRHYPEAMFVNVYGPTEITCNCTYYIVDRAFGLDEKLPMGHPFPNERVFLLDEEDQLVTTDMPNVKGEICVSGTALSLGYFNNWEKTEQVFVQNPLNTRYLELIYRTGDLGEYDSEGKLFFCSRKDFQIKHMGHRIELGEIEIAMNAVDGVLRACCIFDEEENRMLGFYEGEADKKTLTRELNAVLPKFMIPNVFVQTEAMPITKNGKIDRKHLIDNYKKESESDDK